MRRAILITVLAVVAFAVILIARMPASWVIPSHPAAVACSGTDGTVWSGACAGLSVQGQQVGDLTWELHPASLLSGKIGAHIALTRPGSGALQTDIESSFSGKTVTLHNVKADVRMDPALMAALHSDMHGAMRLDLALARVEDGNLTDIHGHIEARDLYQTGGTPGSIGNYAVDFPGGSHPPKGKLRDLGGPLSVEGEVSLEPQRRVVVSGLVAARSNAPADLANQLKILGTPDAQGRRPFSLENSF
jgi:general secretion pathway protein N